MFENAPKQSFDPRHKEPAPRNGAGNDFFPSPDQSPPPAPPAQTQPQNIITQQIQQQMQEGQHVLTVDTHESSTNRRNIIMVVGVLLIVLIGLTLGGFYIVQRLAREDASSLNTAAPATNAASTRPSNNNNTPTNSVPVTNKNSAVQPVNPLINPNDAPDPAVTNPCVYADQVVINPSADTDSDGILDGQESIFGTSIQLADTDSDGYLDGQEVNAGFDPCGTGQL